MLRPLLLASGVGSLVALSCVLFGVGRPPLTDARTGDATVVDALSVGAPTRDTGPCLADVDLPLQVEFVDVPATVGRGETGTARCRIVPVRNAERIEIELRPTAGVALSRPVRESHALVAAGREVDVAVSARLDGSAPRGTVDLRVTAWIEGRPYERGATWHLASEPPPAGKVVTREGRLPVREIREGRVRR